MIQVTSASLVAFVLSLLLATTHEAAASVGWYLLVPPRTNYDKQAEYLQAYKILDSKPLTQWAQEGAYDSAAECEAVRAMNQELEQRFFSSSSEIYLSAVQKPDNAPATGIARLSTEMANANERAYAASRCIIATDPRLAR